MGLTFSGNQSGKIKGKSTHCHCWEDSSKIFCERDIFLADFRHLHFILTLMQEKLILFLTDLLPKRKSFSGISGVGTK